MTEDIKTRPGILVIRFRLEGREKDWGVTALSGKNVETGQNIDLEIAARNHLKKWVPRAEFISWKFLPDPGVKE